MSTPLRVLIAVDGSATALAAARCWSTWRTPADGCPLQATLLHVAPPLPHAWPAPAVAAGELERAMLEHGRAQLRAAEEGFAATSIAWSSEVRIGPVADTILAEGARVRADLIVAGTRGLAALRALLVGGVSMRLVQASSIPLWLMPPGAPAPGALGSRLKLLVAVDGSPRAARAAEWSARIASRFGAVQLELLSVRPQFAPLGESLGAGAHGLDHWSIRIGEAAVAAARAAIAPTGARPTDCVLTGDTVEQICRRADAIDADAIVVGPRGLGVLGQTLLGSVCNALLQVSKRTVVVVPDGTGR